MEAFWPILGLLVIGLAVLLWRRWRRRRPSVVPGRDGQGRFNYRVRGLAIDEAWMNDAIARAGGYRIGDRHEIPSKVKNCDYRLGDLFIELKILEHDLFETPARQDRLIRFFEETGHLKDAGLTVSASDELASDLQKRYWELALSGVESIAKKANRQIRETAKLLGVTEYRGALLLVNKECESVETHSLKRYVEWLIRKEEYSSLHYVLCFSAIPAIGQGDRLAIGFYTSQPPEPAVQAAFDRIVDACRDKVQELLRKNLAPAPGNIGDFNNLRDDRTFMRGGTKVTLASGSRDIAAKNHDKMREHPE